MSGTGMHIAAGAMNSPGADAARTRAAAGCSLPREGSGGGAPDRAVAVFHRERKVAAHQRRAHHLVLAGRHATGEHQRLGAARDAAGQRAHQHADRHLAGSVSARISPRPGAMVQNARAIMLAAGPCAASGMSTSRSAPIRCTDQSKRSPSVGTTRLRQREGRNAGADQQRRDRDMQPIERAGGEEARHGDPAALDEHAAQARVRPASGKDRRNRSPVAARGSRSTGACRRDRGQAHPRRTAAGSGGPPAEEALRASSRRSVSKTTRPATGPSTSRVVSCGSSARTVPAPITTASNSARSRCVWTMSSCPLIQCEAPHAVAMRPSRDCASRPST